jgi:hypothetical protein
MSLAGDGSTHHGQSDHRDLLNLYASDQILRVAVNRNIIETSFDDAWDYAPSQFSHLRSFYGGLATVFANTTLIESDFSILKWEMDENRTCLMHVSLERVCFKPSSERSWRRCENAPASTGHTTYAIHCHSGPH